MQCEFRNKPNTRRGINWRGTGKGKEKEEEEAAELAAMQNLVRPDWYTGRMWVAFVRRCQQQKQRQLAAGIGHFCLGIFGSFHPDGEV